MFEIQRDNKENVQFALKKNKVRENEKHFYVYVLCFKKTVCAGLIFATSLGPIRRHLFEFFYRIHWILFILVAGGLTLHEGAIGASGKYHVCVL